MLRWVKIGVLCVSFLVGSSFVKAQSLKDSTKDSRWNLHYQNTVIVQNHPDFRSRYDGANSLISSKETTTSITGTLYFGLRLWKGASLYLNAELSGGSGFSATKGAAGFPNGEVYRVDDPSPHIGAARYYLTQLFPLSSETTAIEDAPNQLAGKKPASYIAVTVGKFSVMDFFDNNKYSHDPRTQFYNWALMGNGAWDYPADTKGYTQGFCIDWTRNEWSARFATVMVPNTANGPTFDNEINHAKSEALEIEKRYKLAGHEGSIKFLSYLTEAKMGSYQDAIQWGISNKMAPDLEQVNKYGHTKYGFGINLEQELNKYTGLFFRASWNDGQNESWAFTEIDRAASVGLSFDGSLWHRLGDRVGLALMANGQSTEHKNYLEQGGYGFIIGDGQLNYSPEMITEVYYNFKANGYPCWFSPDYQLIINPAYNRDRGPVNAFGIRAHFEF